MEKGTVKFFNCEKGYGFISADNGQDIFFHRTALSMDGFKTVDKGQHVSFEIVDGDRGEKAAYVCLEK
ncbi:cold-shock protein [Holdemania massiliensis]|uniref:cold-shock protein n=1 Tax=Holdemania massiliensis TaxID=1468449 RepID=UPI003522C125